MDDTIYIDKKINKMSFFTENYFIIDSSNDYFQNAVENSQSKAPLSLTGYDGKYYYTFINPEFWVYPKDNDILVKISFNSYLKRWDKEQIKNSKNSYVAKFSLANNDQSHSIIAKDAKYDLDFDGVNAVFHFLDDGFTIIVEAVQKDFEEKFKQIINIVFVYHYFISGNFLKREGPVQIISEDKLVEEIFFNGKFEKLENNNYSKLELKLKGEHYIKGLMIFYKLHNKINYPIQFFILSQSKIEYQIQQRVAILLNTLEGVLKINDNINHKRFSKEARNLLISLSVEKLGSFYVSDEFAKQIENIFISDKLKNDVIKDINLSLSRLHHDTFANTLEKSKNISKIAFNFASKSKIVFHFWKRCKDHRNFFAHLTGSKFKGFDGLESYAAMMTLSTYYRLLIIQLINLSEFVDESIIAKEIEGIDKWKIKHDVSISDE